MFDSLTSSKLQYYVYALINPISNKVFYIGKGIGNRVFSHKLELLDQRLDIGSLKRNEIKEILEKNLDLIHIIIRHGLTENEAYLLEATLIDYHNLTNERLSNEVSGHKSSFYGIKTTDELIRQYNAPKLQRLEHNVVIININKGYSQTKSNISIYEATKQAWVINKKRLPSIQYVLSEFQGIIVGVFKVNNWYQVETNNNKLNNRWGFNGEEATDEIKKIYMNKSIAHTKKRGAANPIRYEI